jgi:hypothetical protein
LFIFFLDLTVLEKISSTIKLSELISINKKSMKKFGIGINHKNLVVSSIDVP